jgi:hypothetical protein
VSTDTRFSQQFVKHINEEEWGWQPVNRVRGRDQMNKRFPRISPGLEELETKGPAGGDDEDEIVAASSQNLPAELVEHLLGLTECEQIDLIGLK